MTRRSVLFTVAAPLTAAVWLASCSRDEPPTAASASLSQQAAAEQAGSRDFQREFNLGLCTWASSGDNPYFKLRPGYTLVLEGRSDGADVRLRIRVLDETRQVAGVTTRVVEERETEDGELVEVSRNYFAICEPSNSVFYFGEEVDNYEDGRIVNHNGSWRAGVNGARAGLAMPGLPLIGARYFQEIAPGIALDRAEILEVDATQPTGLGRFRDVLVTEESTPLEPGARETKAYALHVGLIRDADLTLVRFGMNVR
jgi:hypothetical protein